MLAVTLLVAVCLTNFLLGIFVIANNPKAKLNLLFAALTFSLAVWAVVSFLEDAGLSHHIISLLVKADFALASIMVALFFWFCYELSAARGRYVLPAMLSMAIINIAIPIAGQAVTLEFLPNRVKFIPQPGYTFFMAYTALSILIGLGLLIYRYRKSSGRKKIQLKFIFLGLALMAFIMSLTNIILPNLMNVSPLITRLGIYSILFFTGFTAYAVIKLRFMDIRLLVARSVAYILLLTTLAAFYTLAAFELTAWLFPYSNFTLSEYGVYVILAIILAFSFQPLRRFFEHITDEIFYRDHYDTQNVLNQVSKILASELLLRKLLDSSLEQICQNIKVEIGQFIILETGKIYHVSHFGPLPDKLITLPELHKLSQPMLIADELPDGDAKAVLQRHSLRLSAVLKTNDVMVGYLLLGEKSSGDIYSNQDLGMLEILTSELALAIVNAKAYEEISQFNATLQQKINEETLDLRAANTKLKALDRAKDEFISIASHQLRTPLTSIKGYLSMLREGDVSRMTIEQRQFIDYAYTGSERLVSLISDLLNVSRLSTGRFMLEKQSVDLVEVAADEIKQLWAHAEVKGLQIILKHPKRQIPKLELDENKTRQVIMNFIDNAIYYTPRGSITVSIESDHQNLRLMVSDTGIGVPVTEQKKLFTKFYRAQNAQAIRPDGTGLGLYLAKKVIEDQGGRVVFSSVEGQGSTFGFEFPIPRSSHYHMPIAKSSATPKSISGLVSARRKPVKKTVSSL